MQLDWFPVFRTGKHTDSNGREKDWTGQELDHMVASYDPANHEAPVVIGHPKENAPAWGWVEALKREGDILYAKAKDLVPEFGEMLKKMMFKKRSISLYPDGTLRHIGFLGAVPPAVKGLEDVAFGEGDAVTIEFSQEGGTMLEKMKKMLSGMVDQMKEMMNMMPGQEGGTQMAEKEIQDRIDAGIAAAVKTKETEFAEAQKKNETEFSEKVASIEEARKKKDEALRQAQDDIRKREDALKAKEAEGKKAAIASFTEDLKKKGILIPAMDKLGMGITSFLDAIAAIETTVEFGEGDGKKKQTPLEFMQAFLSGLPKAIEFGEVAGAGKDAKTGNAEEKLSAFVTEKMKANKGMNYTQAFAEVQKEHPELAAEYAEELKG